MTQHWPETPSQGEPPIDFTAPARWTGGGAGSLGDPRRQPQQSSQPVWQQSPAAVRPPRPQLAVVTWSIIAVCVAVWLAERSVPGFLSLVELSPAQGRVQPWRFVTSVFAHSLNLTHILFNMLALWQVGRMLELALGRARFAALYLLSALGGAAGFLLLAPGPGQPALFGVDWYTSVVGASGAIFGLFGALVPLYRRLGVPLNGIWLTLALNAAIAFTIPGIAWQSHLGGFLAGLACGAVLTNAQLAGQRSGKDLRPWWLAAIGVLLVVVIGFRYLVA